MLLAKLARPNVALGSSCHDGTRNDESFWSVIAAHGARRSEVSCRCSTHETLL
jgi:hypothetical protein